MEWNKQPQATRRTENSQVLKTHVAINKIGVAFSFRYAKEVCT